MADIANDSTITTSLKDDHMQRTINQSRESKTISMEIVSVSDLSPTVKHLILLTTEKPIPISFKAGQWVDMIIPGVDTVGGFSICSSPIYFSETGKLSLCVKYSDHPPAEWVHNECQPGSIVMIRVGGDFFFDTNDNSTLGKNILLVGGGVGINPLLSIIAQLKDYRKLVGGSNVKICLLFSAKTKAELLFMESLNEFALEDQTFTVQYFITGNEEKMFKDSGSLQDDGTFEYRRISKVDIESCITNNLNLKIGSEDANMQTMVYVCGPPPMIQHVRDIFKSLRIENVFYEKWW